MSETKRKGARSIKDISPSIMLQLNNGIIETANLVEWLAIDQAQLLQNILQQNKKIKYLQPVITAIDSLKKQTVNTIGETIGKTLFNLIVQNKDDTFLKLMNTHTADTVRCWACYCIGGNAKLTIKQMLAAIQPFAMDPHFGVREIAWIAVRPTIAINLISSISQLETWAKHNNENIRRFASESTRPRGVWCAHIAELKSNPEMALPILELLKNDEAKYVQDSVGNWLNDASKTAPDFVKNICKKWKIESDTKNTDYIIKKAMRTLEK